MVTTMELGADPEGLEALASHLDLQALHLEELYYAIRGGLYGLEWTGTRADELRSEWTSQGQPVFGHAAQGLRAFASELKANAQQQRSASNDSVPTSEAARAFHALTFEAAKLQHEAGWFVGPFLGLSKRIGALQLIESLGRDAWDFSHHSWQHAFEDTMGIVGGLAITLGKRSPVGFLIDLNIYEGIAIEKAARQIQWGGPQYWSTYNPFNKYNIWNMQTLKDIGQSEYVGFRDLGKDVFGGMVAWKL
jgi:hypothetical protein